MRTSPKATKFRILKSWPIELSHLHFVGEWNTRISIIVFRYSVLALLAVARESLYLLSMIARSDKLNPNSSMRNSKMIIRVLFGLVFLISSASSLKAQSEDSTVDVQDPTQLFTTYEPMKGKSGPHPDFILPTIEGDKTIQLSSFRGKKVLLLHFASW